MTPRIGSSGPPATEGSPPDFHRPNLLPPRRSSPDQGAYPDFDTHSLDAGLREFVQVSREQSRSSQLAQVGGITSVETDVDAERSARIREFYAKFTVEVPVLEGAPGETRRIPLPFRMATDDDGYAQNLRRALGPAAPAHAIGYIVAGRATPEQLAATSIDLARRHPEAFGPGKSTAEVRAYLRGNGVGIDCAGSVQLALCYGWGLSPALGRARFGLKEPLLENLAHLKSEHFTNVASPPDLRPGDMIILKPPLFDSVGHTVIVTEKSNATLTDKEAATLRTSFPDLAQPGKQVVKISVASSFGWDGPEERTWIYDPATQQWGDLGGHLFDDDGHGHVTSTPGPHSGPWDHEIQGCYRAK